MKSKFLIAAAIPLFILACAKKPKIEARPEPVAPVIEQPATVQVTPPVQDTKAKIEDLLAEALKPVYFPYDKAELPQESKDLLSKAGDLMKQAPNIKVLIEGNADERGTEAYNLALGEKRAAVVKAYLVQYGINDSRLSLISYGEEKPDALGHDESDWAKNRRDEFKVSVGPEE